MVLLGQEDCGKLEKAGSTFCMSATLTSHHCHYHTLAVWFIVHVVCLFCLLYGEMPCDYGKSSYYISDSIYSKFGSFMDLDINV